MTISFNADNGLLHISDSIESSSSEVSALQVTTPHQEQTSGSSIHAKVSGPLTATQQTTALQKGASKVDELKKAFTTAASIGSDESGTFDEWILDKTKHIDFSEVFFINILAHDIFRHFIQVENNIQSQNIPKRDFNRHYKPSLNRLKGLFSLMFIFNNDIKGHNRNIQIMTNTCKSIKEINDIVYCNKMIISLENSLKLLENEIFRTLLTDQKIKKIMDGKSLQELIFNLKFLKSVSGNESWTNVNVGTNTIASYLKAQGVTINTLTERKLIQLSFTFLESVTHYINASSDRLKKAEKLVGNPSIPTIGSTNFSNKKIFSQNLQNKCRLIQRTLHQLNSQIDKKSFKENFSIYQEMIIEINEIRSCMVSLMTFEPLLVKYFPLEGPFDYNAHVKNLRGWPFKSLPDTDMLRKTFDLQFDQEAKILIFLLNEVMTKKAYSEKTNFDLTRCNEIGSKMKLLYETSLKGQFDEIKIATESFAMSKLCVSVTSRVKEGVENNFYQLDEAINFFATNEQTTISSYQEYDEFINQALSFINSAYRHCDSIISTLFMNLSRDYKEARRKGTDTAPIVEQLDALVDIYEQVVDYVEVFQSVLENGEAPKVDVVCLSSVDVASSTEKADVIIETGSSENITTLPADALHDQPVLLEEVIQSASSSPSEVQEKKITEESKKREVKVTPKAKNSATKQAVTKEAQPKPTLASWKETISESIETNNWDRHIKLRKLLRMMKKDGWKFLDKGRGKGSHIIADAPDGRRVTIPTSGGNGRALKPGTFKSIRGQRSRTGRK